MKEPIFKIVNTKSCSEGYFIWSDKYDTIFDYFYDVSELINFGEFRKADKKLRYLLRKDSNFFPALSDLGWMFFEKNNYSKSREYFHKAYNIANKLIPNNFKGTISHDHIENRHYLRILYGLGTIYFYSHNYKKSMSFYKSILKYNPADDLEANFCIGELYLMLKEYEQAEIILKENLDKISARYNYAILLNILGRYTESIVQFAIGFFENEFIYKVLVSEPIVKTNDYYISSKIHDAYHYYRRAFPLWIDEDKIKFIYNIYNSKTFQDYNLKLKRENIHHFERYKIFDSSFALKVYNEINKVSS